MKSQIKEVETCLHQLQAYAQLITVECKKLESLLKSNNSSVGNSSKSLLTSEEIARLLAKRQRTINKKK
jgi:hypothetical protein